MKKLLLIIAVSIVLQAKAQEFPKGLTMYLEGSQGTLTTFNYYPDLFTAGLLFKPEYTVVTNHLRVGAAGGINYNNKKFDVMGGPEVSIKLATINAGIFGTIANLQLQLQHLWGSDKEMLFGGGLKVEFGQIVLLGVNVHRDYNLDTWWLQGSLAYNLCPPKKRKKI